MSNETIKQKVKSIFLGKKVIKYWKSWYGCEPELSVKTETLERVKILEKEMDFEFQKGEEIYLDNLERYATVEKKTKDTNGNIIYNITYITEIIEDFDPKIKEQYEKEYTKYEKEKENLDNKKIKSKEEEEQSKIEYEDFCEAKKTIPKKGLIIIKPPALFKSDLKKASAYHRYVNENFLNYDVITNLGDMEIFNYDENGKIANVKILDGNVNIIKD